MSYKRLKLFVLLLDILTGGLVIAGIVAAHGTPSELPDIVTWFAIGCITGFLNTAAGFSIDERRDPIVYRKRAIVPYSFFSSVVFGCLAVSGLVTLVFQPWLHSCFSVPVLYAMAFGYVYLHFHWRDCLLHLIRRHLYRK